MSELTISYTDDHRNRKIRSNEEHHANACLMVDYPDMFEALREARSYIISRGNDTVERQKILEIINGILEKL